MYAEVAWVLVSSGTQVQLQIILNPDHLPDYLSVSYDYSGIDNKVRGAELLVYYKISEKTSKIKRPLQLIVPLEIDSLVDAEQSRSHCIEPASEYNRSRREAAKNADMKRKLKMYNVVT